MGNPAHSDKGKLGKPGPRHQIPTTFFGITFTSSSNVENFHALGLQPVVPLPGQDRVQDAPARFPIQVAKGD